MTLATTRRPRLSREELDLLAEATRPLRRSLRNYALLKVRWDPIYALLLPHLEGTGELVNFGAGIGLLERLVAHRSPKARLRAIEWDANKAAGARVVLRELPQVEVLEADGRTIDPGCPDRILFVDVLHYFPPDEQAAWLSRAADALAPGGVLLVRDIDKQAGRTSLTERIERLVVKLGWNRGDRVAPRPMRELVRLLESRGFRVDVTRADAFLFPANVLLVAHKPPEGGM